MTLTLVFFRRGISGIHTQCLHSKAATQGSLLQCFNAGDIGPSDNADRNFKMFPLGTHGSSKAALKTLHQASEVFLIFAKQDRVIRIGIFKARFGLWDVNIGKEEQKSHSIPLSTYVIITKKTLSDSDTF